MAGLNESDNIKVPKRLQIETIYGCNAQCTMCVLGNRKLRNKGIMPQDLFNYIVDSMASYISRVDMVDLFGIGEPLLDPYIFERIRYVKDRGFKNLSISTNADLLDEKKQKRLLDTEIETVIISIDGIKRSTYESIRRGLSFDRVVANTENIIRMRDENTKKTRFLIRFIRQKKNAEEWDDFKSFWEKRISPSKRDQMSVYNVNTMGGEVYRKEDLLGDNRDERIERLACHQVFDRLIILNDGRVPLCCEDTPFATVEMGNVKDTSPIEIFNGKKFERIRKIHESGEKCRIPLCDECTMLYSEDVVRIF